MKFQLKTLAVAAILAVSAGQASAAVNPATDLANGTELLFWAYDTSNKNTYVQDLGVMFKSFLPDTAFSLSTSVAGANWDAFLANTTAGTTSVKWAVTGVIRGGLTADAIQMSTTVRAGTTTTAINSQVTSPFRSAVSSVVNAVGGLNGSDTNYAENKDYFLTGASNLGQMGQYFGASAGGGLKFNVDNTIGTSANFWLISGAAGGTAKTKNYLYDGLTMNFDGANFVVSAVPEPSTYAMLVAGLALVGGVAARRRKSSK